MISVEEVIHDPDFTAPQPFTIVRSTLRWVQGGTENIVTETLQQFGPVQAASPKEVAMLAEADRVSQVKAFWATVPVYVTRGYANAPVTHGETPQGALPGTVFTLTVQPPADCCNLILNGVMLTPEVDYWINGLVLTLSVPAPSGAVMWLTWPIMARIQSAESDVIQYSGEQYRVLSVYFENGGYWKALGTRLAAS